MNHFISFADSRMTDSLNRLCRQAEALEFFDEITSFTEHDLLPEFTSRMGKYLIPSCKGFGYWSWKPWIISHALRKMKEGDRLLYLDAGCHINPEGRKRFREYVDILDRHSNGMLVFYNGQPEYKWTKGDIFRHFSISPENTRITHTQQIAAGHVFIKKTPWTVELIRDWLHIFYNHLNLVDNSPSVSPNLEGFVENRYDQSIFFHPVQTAWHYSARLFGNLRGRLEPACRLPFPGPEGHGAAAARKRKVDKKNQELFLLQIQRIRNPESI